jgi:hypothetical protein
MELPKNQNHMKTNIFCAFAFALALVAGSHRTFGQGSLTPPGAPAPTMKSLDQVEARTPVDAAHTPGDGGNNLFIISQPGSYYLTTNIYGVANKNGIEITSGNVFLDLNGFSLLGTSNSRDGIVIFSSTQSNITVCNGNVSGWGNGYFGIESNGRNVVFERLKVSDNTQGISAKGGTVIRDCIVTTSAFSGISIYESGSVVANNTLIGNNSLNIGGDISSIYISGYNNRIEGNHITGSGPSGYGIRVANNAANTNNIIIRNSVEGGGANNYYAPASNDVGPIGSASTNASPWGNISH